MKKDKLESLISGYQINAKDADWLRSLLIDEKMKEQRDDLLTTMTQLKANLSPSTSRQIDCVVAIKSVLDKYKPKI